MQEAAKGGCCSAACTCEGHATWLSDEAEQAAASPTRTCNAIVVKLRSVVKLRDLQRCQPGELPNLRRKHAELYAAERPAKEEDNSVTTPGTTTQNEIDVLTTYSPVTSPSAVRTPCQLW